MKYLKDYINKLKECTSSDEVWFLMKGRIYNGSKNSKFEDDIIYLPRSSGKFSGVKIKNDNKLYSLALRVLIYLKLDGEISRLPLNSGKSTYVRHLCFIFRNIPDSFSDINRIDELRGDVLDYIIDNNTFTSEGKFTTTLSVKLNKFNDWIIFANDKLPFFLRINESILLESNKYIDMNEKYKKIKHQKSIIGDSKRAYPLPKFKYLVGESIDYLEKYSEDCLLAAKMYMDIQGLENKSTKKYSHTFDYFSSTSHKFDEPILKDFQIKCRNSATKYTKNNGKFQRAVMGGLVEQCISAPKRLEGACISIILMITGMRNHELTRLERYPIITEGEYLNFRRLIYKTSSLEQGEELIIPIPPIVEKALVILSKLSEIKDGCKYGSIIVNDFRFLESESTDARVQASINYFSKHIGLKDPPIPHEFRHAIAFLIVHLNSKDGLDLARMFLGHKSIMMTLQYMGHYNELIRDAINETYKEGSKEIAEVLINELREGRGLHGRQGKRLMGGYEFIGSYAESFTDLLTKSLFALIEKGQLLMIQAEACVCFHDMASPKDMVCQRGFGITNYVGVAPIPARCERDICPQAIFTEKNLDDEDEYGNEFIDEDLKKIFKQNNYITLDDGLDTFNPVEKIINEYRKYKSKVI